MVDNPPLYIRNAIIYAAILGIAQFDVLGAGVLLAIISEPNHVKECPHFQELLRELKIDRVGFDSHRLLEMNTQDPDLLDAKRRKPKAPARGEALGPTLFSVTGHPRLEPDLDVLNRWAVLAGGWIRKGRTPYIYMHQAPDDVDTPRLCRIIHGLKLKRLPSLPNLPP